VIKGKHVLRKVVVVLVLLVFSLFSLLNFGALKTVSADESCNLFSDNFEREGIGPNWKVYDDAPASNWIIQNGQLYQNNNVYREDHEFDYFEGTNIIAGSFNWTNYTFSFDFKAMDNDGVGALFRYKDQNNYYRFLMVQDPGSNGPFSRIDKIVNGQPFQVLAIDTKKTFTFGRLTHVTISVVGNNIKVTTDDGINLTATDNTFSSGKIGFMTYACYAYFDNVCVTGESNPVPVTGNAPKNLKQLQAMVRLLLHGVLQMT